MADANTAAAEKPNWLCSRERGTVRTQILSVAQDLLRREGPDAVTLGAIARKTKIPRATVYSLFSSRQELLSQLQPVEAKVEPEPAPEPEVVETAEASASEAVPVAEITPEPQERETAGIENVGGAYDELMREQAEALQELSKQVIVAKPRQRDATETALSRLDARVAVTEQSLAALEQRMGERLKSLTSETSTLSENLAGLRMRIHKFEERQLAALAQLKQEVHGLGGVPVTPLPEPVVETPEEPAAEIEPVAQEAETPEPPEDAPDVPKMPTYLTSARLAAIHAAARAAAMPVQPRPPRSLARRFVRRNRWLLVAVAAVLVVWFDVYVFAHYQPADAAGPAEAEVVRSRAAQAPVAWNPRAQLVRGLKYLNGAGVPVDIGKAHLWLERAALRGNPVAQNLMGVLYQTGTGVPVDIAAAIRWYEAAAAQGNLKAMTNLGKIYAGGWREGTDYTKAAEWFAKAAAYGEVDAQFDLAVLYERGEGVPRNTLEAYKWYMIAGKNGDDHAATRATALATQFDPDALQAVDTAVAGFAPHAADRAANEVPTVSG